jgi:uncharacterized membrane protein YgdD (TMEM256/DUF423 family)
MRRNYFGVGAFMIAVGVAMGAMGAHGLEGKISTHYLDVWKKGSEYWMYSALAIMATSSFIHNREDETQVAHDFFGKWGLLFWALLGTGIFSITLWLLSLNELLGENLKKLGMITPIGGVMMIVSWFFIGLRILRLNRFK